MTKLFSLCFIILLGSIGNLSAQIQPKVLTLDTNGTYYYEKVFELSGKSKDEIFEGIKLWVIKNVKTQSNTNYFDEKDKSNISTTPAFTVSYNATVNFKLNIDIKDGKYRVSATSFIYENMQGISKTFGDYTGLYAPKKVQQKTMDDVEDNFNKILSSINSSTSKKSDW